MATYKPIRKTASGTEEIKIPYAVLADAPDLSKYVTTDTAQTISGAKTFAAQPIINTSNGLKFTSGNCALRIYNTSASPTDYSAIEVRSNSTSTNRNLFIDLANNSLVVGQASGNPDTTYKVNVKDTFNATTISENGTSLSDKYLGKTAKAADADKLDGNNSSYYLNYDNLSNTPTIPTVNNGTLTIQKNGTNVQTFSANQSGNVTANITVPIKVSELTNDSGFTTNTGTITGIKMNGVSKGTSGVVDLGTVITAHQDISGKANLSGGNTFTGKQTLNSPASDGYSINAAGYIKGSWLQASSTANKGSNTGKVCVFDGSGWIYYRTPSEILSEASGVPKSAFSLSGTTLTITI